MRVFLIIIMILVGVPRVTHAQEFGGLAQYRSGQIVDSGFGKAELELTLSQAVRWRVFTLDDPRRVVVDFWEVDWRGADPKIMDQSDHVDGLRFGGMQPGWSRMVMDLANPMAVNKAWMDVSEDDGQAQLRISLSSTDPVVFSDRAGAPKLRPDLNVVPDLLQKVVPDPGGKFVVMIDPGHGGIDPGAEREGVTEANLVLIFARELREVLLRTGDYAVHMTRDGDHFVSLEGRVAAAHHVNADLFISLHADALPKGVAYGASVYTLAAEASDAASAALAERHNRSDLLSGVDLSEADDRVAQVLLDLARLDNTPRSKALAGHVVEGIRNALGHLHKKPQREAGFSVLKSADIPSILVELGFLSTPEDRKNLQDPIWRAGMAAGIRDGIGAWALEDAALKGLRRQ